MRIISGTAKGKKLFAPKTLKIRPVADKVKGSIFNILRSMEGSRVLDLFAGSGSVGLEAASRGAALVVFSDSLPQALSLLRKNILRLSLPAQTVIVRGNLPRVLSQIRRRFDFFDFIFVDPPYDKNFVNPTLRSLLKNKLIDAQTTIIIEHSPRELPECEGLSMIDQRKYGQTLVSFLRKDNGSD